MWLLKYICIGTLMILTGCSFETKIPVDTLVYPGSLNTKNINNNSSRLIVLLRGYGNDIHYFEQQGWIRKLQQRYPEYSIIVPDLHFGYYKEGIFSERLYADVIKPAKQRGVKSIWLAGISMGGLGAIMTSEFSPKDIGRLFLFAPYLGDGTIQTQIKDKGSLVKWNGQSSDEDKWQYKMWSYLKRTTESKNAAIPVYLGYGEQDDMPGLQYLAASLPEQRLITLAGGHKDGVFTALFEQMLERGFFD